MTQTLAHDFSNERFESRLRACQKKARIDNANEFVGAFTCNEGNTPMTHKTYIAMATAFALALGSLSPALAEEAPMDDKGEMATEGTAQPAGDAPDKSAESTEDKG